MPLGMEDHRILSGHLRASSSYNYNHGPDRARLNIVNGHGRTGAWVARHRNTKQFLQIDLRQLSLIKGIATQGRREAHQWVKSYTLSYSRTGLRFNMYAAYGRIKVRIVWFFPFWDKFSTLLSSCCVGIPSVFVRALFTWCITPSLINIGVVWRMFFLYRAISNRTDFYLHTGPFILFSLNYNSNYFCSLRGFHMPCLCLKSISETSAQFTISTVSAIPWQLWYLSHCDTPYHPAYQSALCPSASKKLAKLYCDKGRVVWLPRQRWGP